MKNSHSLPLLALSSEWSGSVMDETRCSQAHYSPLKMSKRIFTKITKKLEQGLLPWQWWSNKAFAPEEFAKVCEELWLSLFISLFSKIDWSWISTMDCSFFSSGLSKGEKVFWGEERRGEPNVICSLPKDCSWNIYNRSIFIWGIFERWGFRV